MYWNMTQMKYYIIALVSFWKELRQFPVRQKCYSLESLTISVFTKCDWN
jgi:hypothetical protein